MIELEYKNLCPNCGGRVNSKRLEQGLPCEICLPEHSREMKEGFLTSLIIRNRMLGEIEEIFKKLLRTNMWALQRFWARRFLDGESFALIAPTGSGKTTMQIILSLYASSKMGKRCLIILPTSILVHQVSEKLISFKESLNLKTEIAFYHSLLTKKEKEEQLGKMFTANIIVTTHLSIIKREEINSQLVDLVFVDDVDSFLKRSKSVMFVFKMLKLPKRMKNVILNVYEKKMELKNALEKIEKIKGEEEIRSQIIVSGATPRGKRTRSILLLSRVFGFTLGGRVEFGRKVLDSYLKPRRSMEEEILEIIKRVGGGALIFIPSDKGSKFAESLEQYLCARSIRAKAFLKPNRRYFEMFEKGELDFLIGIATTRSPLVRGIDLPHRIRYAIFAGVPKFLIRINLQEFHPAKWLMLLNNISHAIGEEYRKDFETLVRRLAKIQTLNAEQLKLVREALQNGIRLKGFLEYVREVAMNGMEFFNKILKDHRVIEAIRKSPIISFGMEKNEYYFLVVDEIAYLQASGRTSRLYIGGLTKGLSIVVIDDEKAFNNLIKEISYLGEEIEWKNFDEIDVVSVMREIDEDRRKVLLAQEDKLKVEEKISLSTILFIVESPNKARTIARYFGKPFIKKIGDLKTFEVFMENSLAIITASKGHITDLDLVEGLFGVKVGKKFIPIYRPIKRCVHCGRDVDGDVCSFCNRSELVDAGPRIKVLRRVASLVDKVVIGTDPDAEGEKIAFDLYLLLKPFNSNIKRVKFHEVTKKGIISSLKSLEDFDMNLVEAQIVRRIEDRWIGFSISPVLWRFFHNTNLSAGRVQTPVLGWIYERTKRLKEKQELLNLTLANGLKISLRGEIGTFKRILKNRFVEILKVERVVQEIHPYPPFTTDTLLSALTSSLKINATEAMKIAQKLFESGLITYHRTSSTTVSNTGIAIAKDYISSNFGEAFFMERRWQMEGAHECIRPTKAIDSERLRSMIALRTIRVSLSEQELKAYDIIFRRFIASQMKSTKVEKVFLKISVAGKEVNYEFTTNILEEGFSRLIPFYVREIPEIKVGKQYISSVRRKIVRANYPFTYSEIISLMKEKGIGRPSTYAKILEILKRRKYVNEINMRLFSTPLGAKVYSFLREKYGKYLSEELTKSLEEKMDEIEKGKLRAHEVIKEFLGEVNEIMKDAMESGVKYNVQIIL
ncbi:MAG: reverse gyrase [Candidatus Nanoarchaeia archaeon]|nr:reverse gyrase [Candidatus Haiyanarchaeum thermophilum]MCW1302968.1 reverse gyrase [Candidatus Haiyanarchaeum thermophilum]MCW1303646.1 reverse gyrase [Candidatus Haiyanarchaeum thermophilum]MCW1306327.1 reverse gyrase [Candidatus Haiyanarchaeum thermophilum]MCW1307163.1 reverse gyrase [Candidatus Haiyanarchaeum thermophilum]